MVTKTTYGSPTNVVFGVISDTHVTAAKTTEQQRLAKAFRFFAGSNVNADVVVGDLTDSGSASEYNTWKSIKDANKGSVPLIASMGNHEGNTPDGFMTATGNKPNANYVRNGYHFITLSPAPGLLIRLPEKANQGGSDYSYVLSWLETQLTQLWRKIPQARICIFPSPDQEYLLCIR